MNIEQQPHNNEILTIEKVLGPNSDYNQIIVDLKSLLEKHKGVVFSDYEEEGIYLSNMTLLQNKTVDPLEYKEAIKEWQAFMHNKKIPVNTSELGRFLYCKGETELVEQIDLGHGPEGQKNPQSCISNTICS